MEVEASLRQLSIDVSYPPPRKASCCNISGKSTTLWADLPSDMLSIIFGLLHNMNNHYFLDLYQCLSVCRSWRCVAKQIWLNHILPTAPWLFSKERRYKIIFNTNLYKLHEHHSLNTNDNHPSSFHLDLNQMETFASHDGWFLVGTSHHQPYLYNPVTAHLIQLPHLPDYLRLHSHMKFVSSRTMPTDLNCIICLKFSSKRDFMDNYKISLAFCRPASSSSSWHTLKERAEDVIFCGGKFYAIDTSGSLFVYNEDIINGNTSKNQSLRKIRIAEGLCTSSSRPYNTPHRFFFYLAESTAGELLLIKRIFEQKVYTTESFCLYKLKVRTGTIKSHKKRYNWDIICSLGQNESLILGWNDCISISVDNDHVRYKSNCIYFYDELMNGQLVACGMYDLKSCTIIKKSQYSPGCWCGLFTPPKLSDV